MKEADLGDLGQSFLRAFPIRMRCYYAHSVEDSEIIHQTTLPFPFEVLKHKNMLGDVEKLDEKNQFG